LIFHFIGAPFYFILLAVLLLLSMDEKRIDRTLSFYVVVIDNNGCNLSVNSHQLLHHPRR
jgi:hypothetical protein